jgi:hypothetical protein
LVEQKIRGFQLLVNPTSDAFGITLEETNGKHDNVSLVARVDDVRTRSVLASVMDAVKASGLQRTSLGRQRKTPIVLTEEAGVRLALALLVTERVTKPRRIDAMLGAINNMAVEEAYYWYSKCMSTEASRVRKALRIFLAEE